MKPTIPFLKEKFIRFNNAIFGGRLPEIPITLCDVSSFIGQYKSKIRVNDDGRREHYDHLLRFSAAFDLSERDLEDVVIHEMIHYFIAYNGLNDRTAHGPLFKALMQSVNENHGRNISVSHRTTRGQIEEAKSVKSKWHIIAILHFTSGQSGVKVLPRVIPKIIAYYRAISASTNISRVDLFLHNDPWFNRFPTSVGRRCQAITKEEIADHLKGAHTLLVKGNKLIQN